MPMTSVPAMKSNRAPSALETYMANNTTRPQSALFRLSSSAYPTNATVATPALRQATTPGPAQTLATDLDSITAEYAAWSNDLKRRGWTDEMLANNPKTTEFQQRIISAIGQIKDPVLLQQQIDTQTQRLATDPTSPFANSAKAILAAAQSQQGTVGKPPADGTTTPPATDTSGAGSSGGGTMFNNDPVNGQLAGYTADNQPVYAHYPGDVRPAGAGPFAITDPTKAPLVPAATATPAAAPVTPAPASTPTPASIPTPAAAVTPAAPTTGLGRISSNADDRMARRQALLAQPHRSTTPAATPATPAQPAAPAAPVARVGTGEAVSQGWYHDTNAAGGVPAGEVNGQPIYYHYGDQSAQDQFNNQFNIGAVPSTTAAPAAPVSGGQSGSYTPQPISSGARPTPITGAATPTPQTQVASTSPTRDGSASGSTPRAPAPAAAPTPSTAVPTTTTPTGQPTTPAPKPEVPKADTGATGIADNAADLPEELGGTGNRTDLAAKNTIYANASSAGFGSNVPEELGGMKKSALSNISSGA